MERYDPTVFSAHTISANLLSAEVMGRTWSLAGLP
jgi:hypothetical protein